MKTHTVGAWLLAASFTLVACGQAAAVSSAAPDEGGSAATALSDATASNANAPWHGDPNTLGVEHILPMLHVLPHEAMAGLNSACDANAVHTQISACGDTLPGNAQASWSNCSAMSFGRGPPPPLPQDGNGGMPPGFHHGGPHHGHGVSSGQLTVTTTVAPADPNAACDASTVISVQRQAQFTVHMGNPNDPNRPSMQVIGNNQETMTRVYGSNDQNITLTLDMNRTLTSSAGAVLHQGTVSGTVHIHETRSSERRGPPARVVDGNLSVSGDALVLTGLQVSDPRSCPWPTAGSVQRTGSDGTTRTLTFTSPCGSATLDGASVTLPVHHGHGGPHGHPY